MSELGSGRTELGSGMTKLGSRKSVFGSRMGELVVGWLNWEVG